MAEDHLSPELLAALWGRESRREELLAEAYARLITHCPTCRAEWEAFVEEAAASGRDLRHQPFFEHLRAALPSHAKATAPALPSPDRPGRNTRRGAPGA